MLEAFIPAHVGIVVAWVEVGVAWVVKGVELLLETFVHLETVSRTKTSIDDVTLRNRFHPYWSWVRSLS